MKKRWIGALLLALLLLTPATLLAQKERPTFGVCIYNGEDTFISSLLVEFKAEAEGKVDLIIYDSQNDQNLQNDQIVELIDQGVDALIINPVDRTTSVFLVGKAKQHDIPIVIYNREPVSEDLSLFDKAYYVGIDPKEQGYLEGQMAADYFLSHPEADINGDGVMQLVLIRGEPGHQDAELRSSYTIKALYEAGIAFDILSEPTAMWDRVIAQEQISSLLNIYSQEIECIISNNDDMALGAIDALKAVGYFSGDAFIPVIGNDATVPALEALRQGSLYATVYNNAYLQAVAAIDLAVLLSGDIPITTENFSFKAADKVVYISSDCYRTDFSGGYSKLTLSH